MPPRDRASAKQSSTAVRYRVRKAVSVASATDNRSLGSSPRRRGPRGARMRRDARTTRTTPAARPRSHSRPTTARRSSRSPTSQPRSFSSSRLRSLRATRSPLLCLPSSAKANASSPHSARGALSPTAGTYPGIRAFPTWRSATSTACTSGPPLSLASQRSHTRSRASLS